MTVRLYGIYFALLTLAFAQMVFFIVEQAKDWTNGDDGLQSFPNALLPIGPWNVDLSAPLPSVELGTFGNLGDISCGTSSRAHADRGAVVHAHADALAVRRSARPRSARTKSAAS